MDGSGLPSAPKNSPFHQLPSLPQLNKSQFIQSYIQTQKTHSKVHAREGLALFLAWANQESEPKKLDSPISSSKENFGFNTPVLKPRSHPPPVLEAMNALPMKSAVTKTQDKKENLQEKTSTRTVAKKVQPKTQTQATSTDKKREHIPSSDDEEAARKCRL